MELSSEAVGTADIDDVVSTAQSQGSLMYVSAGSDACVSHWSLSSAQVRPKLTHGKAK